MSIEIQVVTPEQMATCIAEVDASDDAADLAEMWARAKAVENAATEVRSHIGKKLAKLLPVPDGQQSKTHTVGEYKVNVKPAINYKVDWSAFDAAYRAYVDEAVLMGLPTVDAPEGTPKRQLDEKGLRWVRENAIDLYRHIASAITATPGTTGIDVEHKPKKDK